MASSLPCIECEAIARELAEAYLNAWSASDRGTQAAWKALYKMVGGTEADVERAEELLPKARPVKLDIGEILRRKFEHEGRTGHKVPRPFRRPQL
jgi:hypothetical protein